MNFNSIINALVNKKKLFVVHPFLFALFPFLFLYSYNLGHVYFYQIIIPSLITIIFTLIFFLILKLFINDSKKVGIILSFSLIIFFSYGHIFSAIKLWQISKGIDHLNVHRYLLLTLLPIYSYVIYRSLKATKELLRLTKALNLGAIFLFLGPLLKICEYEFYMRNDISKLDTNKGIPSLDSNIEDAEIFPDIYYIIPDGHASSNTLLENFKYDNSDFTNYLIDKGFYIAKESKANYMYTGTSLSSTLAMDYLPPLDKLISQKIIPKNNVGEFLKSFGYKYVNFSSGWSHPLYSKYADININCGPLNEFLMILIPTTLLKIIDDKFNLLRTELRDRVLCSFSKLAELNSIYGPKFVFAHIEIPHPPFVFDANGEMVSTTQISLTSWLPKESYLNQLIFTQNMLKDVISQILEKSIRPPIIIIQSDHGPATTFSDSNDLLYYPPNEINIRERMGIINALFLPGKNCSDLLYDSISPVNNFRLIFNCYFNTNFDYLDDLSFFNNNEGNAFINITDIVKTSKLE